MTEIPRFTWFPFDVDDWLTSKNVRYRMQDFQRGWYIEMLANAWRQANKCHLDNDTALLMGFAGCKSPEKWEKHSSIVLAQFEVALDGKTIFNRRQLECYEQQLSGYEKRKAAGKKGGESKAAKQCSSNATAMLKQPSNLISSGEVLISDLTEETAKQFELDDQQAADYVKLELGIGGDQNRMAILDAVRSCIHHGKSPKEAAELLVDVCREFNKHPDAKFGLPAFLKSGKWKTPEVWRNQRDQRVSASEQRTSAARDNITEALRRRVSGRTGVDGGERETGAEPGTDGRVPRQVLKALAGSNQMGVPGVER